jgi:signal recognition particle subunit SEC65
MSIYVGNLSYFPIVVSPSFARFVASELQPQSLTKKDIVKCLKALGIKNPEILSLKWKQELWIQLQFAAVSKI